MTKPKILWHSNAPWSATGYGQETAVMVPLLAEDYDVKVSAFYGLNGSSMVWKGVQVLPGVQGDFGNLIVPAHAKAFFGDLDGGLVFTLLDVWVLNGQVWDSIPTAAWVPVDSEPVPGPVEGFFADTGAIPVAMSEFGREQLAGYDPLYVPHAVEAAHFAPLDRQANREITGLDKDAFIVGMVAANKGQPSRKCFAENLEAFANLHAQHEDAVLYLHTELTGEYTDGVQMAALIKAIGIPTDAVRTCDQYRYNYQPFGAKTMGHIYGSLDILLGASAGEGFGIPLMEAQAAGTPVIATNHSAMSEVCKTGWLVDYEREWTPMGSWQAKPLVDEITSALFDAYNQTKTQKRKMSETAQAHARPYEATRVYRQHLKPAVEECLKRIDARRPK
jgi:glycosyltransferase involved in cell wall biosynthesis